MMEGSTCVPDGGLVTRQLKIAANAARAKKQYDDELEAQRKKLEMEKLAELAALRQKEELRRFGERLDAFLRQRRVKREFMQDNQLDEIQARIEDLEHAAEVLVKNTETQAAMARELLSKKQSEHHVVARKQLVQHKHDIDLLALMKGKVDKMLAKARKEADQIYKNGNHGYNPVKSASATAPAPSPAPAPKKDAASPPAPKPAVFLELSSDEKEQEIMVDAHGLPVLPMSEPTDLNAPLEPAMEVPKAAVTPAAIAVPSSPNPPPPPTATDAEAETDGIDNVDAEAFDSFMPVPQAEFRQQFSEEEAEGDAESDATEEEEAASDEVTEEDADEVTESQLDSALPVEAELI
jgi:hypothetical protein